MHRRLTRRLSKIFLCLRISYLRHPGLPSSVECGLRATFNPKARYQIGGCTQQEVSRKGGFFHFLLQISQTGGGQILLGQRHDVANGIKGEDMRRSEVYASACAPQRSPPSKASRAHVIARLPELTSSSSLRPRKARLDEMSSSVERSYFEVAGSAPLLAMVRACFSCLFKKPLALLATANRKCQPEMYFPSSLDS